MAFQTETYGRTVTNRLYFKSKLDFDIENQWLKPMMLKQIEPSDRDQWIQQMRYHDFSFDRCLFDDFCKFIKAAFHFSIEIRPLDKNPDRTIVREVILKVPLGVVWQHCLGAVIADWILATTGVNFAVSCEACRPETIKKNKRRSRISKPKNQTAAKKRQRRSKPQETTTSESGEVKQTTPTSQHSEQLSLSEFISDDSILTTPLEVSQNDLNLNWNDLFPEINNASGDIEHWQLPELAQGEGSQVGGIWVSDEAELNGNMTLPQVETMESWNESEDWVGLLNAEQPQWEDLDDIATLLAEQQKGIVQTSVEGK